MLKTSINVAIDGKGSQPDDPSISVIDSNNASSPIRCQAIIWSIAGLT